ncbi:MAG TPA: hypothetical protein VNS22_14285 [Geminicoccus sp.]|uniref:hypothetical protein n=1 Tax=Geminicoccus sp. TaxID=2024832 RepID=UPI002CC3BBD8|nr:hypothetical protein [Geminicoccus sp.]HWL69538.1 hypothetical protein [Geminicoccus sp.]
MTAVSREGAQDPGRHVAGPGYQQTDVKPRNVLYMTGLLIAGILFAIGFVAGLFVLLDRHDRRPVRTGLESTALVPPAPRLQLSPQHDRMVIEQRARAMLQGYAWTDRAAGRVRIPIEQAMEEVAQQGWRNVPREPAP